MVGVPRSRGCSTCIRRRVKCDEKRPACAKCQTYGVECPGYERTLKFVDRSHRRPQPSWKDKAEPLKEPGKKGLIREESWALTSSASNKTFDSEWQSGDTLGAYIPPRHVFQAQCLAKWIENLSRGYSSSQDENLSSRLFCFIPVRLGISKALDLAVRCLTVHNLGIMEGNENIVLEGRFAYGKAICAIQKAIYDPKEALKSETLCATMVLSIYELFACTKPDAWMKHAAGVRKIMQLRGPNSFKSDFDSAMVMSYKGMVIMEALFSGKACFLDSDEWRDIAPQKPTDTFTAQFYEKTAEISHCLAACPWLITEMYSLKTANPLESSTKIRVATLTHSALEFYSRLQQWYEDFTAIAPLPEEVPSLMEDELYPVVYRYCNPTIATVFSGYYAITIILHGVLVDCRHPTGDVREISLATDKICKTIEYMSESGIMGPFRVGFAMRVAFEVGTVTTKLWIRKWLLRFEKFYKACSPDNYPPIEIPEESAQAM